MTPLLRLEEGNKIRPTSKSSEKTVLLNGSTLRQTVKAPHEVSKSEVNKTSDDAKK